MAQVLYIRDTQDRKYMVDEQTLSVEQFKADKEMHRLIRRLGGPEVYSIYTHLIDSANKKHDWGCWPTYESIMDDLGILNRAIIADALHWLFDAGLIEWGLEGRKSWFIPLRKANSSVIELLLHTPSFRYRTINSSNRERKIVLIENANVYQDNVNQINELTTPKGVAAPPPKSTTIDLVETDCYQEPQPEQEQEQEQTTLPSSRQVEVQPQAQYTYPALSTPATSKKVKVDSAPGAGAVGGVGKEKKAKPRDPNLDNPAVLAYQNKFKLTPDEGQRDLIVTQITDLGEWDAALDYWKDNKYRPLSVGKLVDCYCKGGYKNELPGTGKRNDRGTGMGGAGSRGKVTTHPAAPNPRYWDQPAEDIEREWAEFRLR